MRLGCDFTDAELTARARPRHSDLQLRVRPRPRARTYEALLAEAMKRVSMGELVSVADVAAGAGVPRATAYRYFPTQNRLVNVVVMRSLGAAATDPLRTLATVMRTCGGYFAARSRDSRCSRRNFGRLC